MSSSHGSVPAKSAAISGSAESEGTGDERLVTGSEPIAVGTEGPPFDFQQLEREQFAAAELPEASAREQEVVDLESASPIVATTVPEGPDEELPSSRLEVGDDSIEAVAPVESMREAGSEITEESSSAQASFSSGGAGASESGSSVVEANFDQQGLPSPIDADDLVEEEPTEHHLSGADSSDGADPRSAVEPDEEIEDVSGLIIEGEALSPEAAAALDSASGYIEGASASSGGPIDDDPLRRIAPPPFPPDIMTSASGATPAMAMAMTREESQDATVISQPPSPEMLAALARQPRSPAPFGSFAPEARGGVRLSVLQLGVMLIAAAAGGGGLVHYLKGPGGLAGQSAPPIATERAAPAEPPKTEAPPVAAPAEAAAAASTAGTPAAAAPAVAPTTPAAAPPGPTAGGTGDRPAVRRGRHGVGRRASILKRSAARRAAKAKKAFVDPFE